MERTRLKAMEDDGCAKGHQLHRIAQVFEARYYHHLMAAAASVGREIGGSISRHCSALCLRFRGQWAPASWESVHVSLARSISRADLWVDNVMMLNVVWRSPGFISDNALGALIVPDLRVPLLLATCNVGDPSRSFLHFGVKSDRQPELRLWPNGTWKQGGGRVFHTRDGPGVWMSSEGLSLNQLKVGYRAGAGQSRRPQEMIWWKCFKKSSFGYRRSFELKGYVLA